MATSRDLGSLAALPIEIEGILDQRSVTMRELIALRPGSLMRLQRSAGEYVDVMAGGAVLGFGEVVVVENVIGIRMTVFTSEQ
jgi:flagellar motor switch protein FliN/FliY